MSEHNKTLSNILILTNHSHLSDQAAAWFASKWDVPIEAYLESIQKSVTRSNPYPQWYIITNNNQQIVAGAGVIENDFHVRTDLTPNLCALYIEESYRGQHLANELLHFIRKDLGQRGINQLYLVTDLDSFYEKNGWNFLALVDDLEGEKIRLYTAPTL